MIDSVVDSVSTCQMMSRLRAPSAFRRPISRVRSLTTISMMFMMTMPPTSSDSDTMPRSTANALWLKVRQRFISVSDVKMPKSSASRGRSLRSMRIATRPSSRDAWSSEGSGGLTVSSSERRAPNSCWNLPSGMTAKLSCDWPKNEPFFPLTPTTRKCVPPILMTWSTGLRSLNSLSAVSHPRSTTGRLRCTSSGLGSRPCSVS